MCSCPPPAFTPLHALSLFFRHRINPKKSSPRFSRREKEGMTHVCVSLLLREAESHVFWFLRSREANAEADDEVMVDW